MKHFRVNEKKQAGPVLGCVMICLALIWIAGCQPFAKARNKEALARDKFSCGEPLPPRMP